MSAGNEGVGQLVLGRYRVMRRLAQGGMGVVYLGRLEGAAGFAKPVVIKRIIADPEDQQGSLARFVREAQILSNLQHPGIVDVLDFAEEADGYAMVLEYVHGYDLGRWLKYLQLKATLMHWEEAVLIVIRVLEALGYAHAFRRSDGSSAEVLHRDISPGNVLIDVDGRVRLVDFGIARMAASTGDLYKTETGVLKGKLAFLAPELFAASPPTPSSDVYACGVVLYQMLAGANPFTAHNDSRVMWRVIMEGPKPIGRQRDDLPPGLETALFVALAKDPKHRHASAERFADVLRGLLVRSEGEIGIGLRDHVRADFYGDMPTLLRLETLGERDRGWRPEPVAITVPSRDVGAWAPSGVPSSATPQTLSHEPDVVHRRQERDAVTARASAPATPDASRGRAEGSRRPSLRSLSYRSLLGLGMAMSLVMGLTMAGALFLLRKPPPPPGAARFIVVEASDPSATPAAAAAPAASPPAAAGGAGALAAPHGALPTPPASGPAEPSRVEPASARARPVPQSDSSVALSRTFARRERALGECFEHHAAEVEGQPEIAIDFEVGPSGHVNSASLAPRALNGTPLGQCLLGVARGTEFGPLAKVTRFSIPIRARAVRR